jgi:thioredoxin-like negative regulator of GroEL
MDADATGDAEATKPIQLDDGDDMDAFVDEHEVALVEFYTNGCAICQSMEPVLGTVAKVSDVSVGLVNPRDDPVLVDEFQIKSVPALWLFVDGEPVAHLADGFVGVEGVLEFLETNDPTR